MRGASVPRQRVICFDIVQLNQSDSFNIRYSVSLLLIVSIGASSTIKLKSWRREFPLVWVILFTERSDTEDTIKGRPERQKSLLLLRRRIMREATRRATSGSDIPTAWP